ncbi:MAG TPA: orotate phosphoribosyltransferase, partial [Phycisphaerae bacterium]|nr:orotate phosphoribosyltransferase [Phycisphaerae bacterium]
MSKTINDFVKFDNPRSLFPLSSTKRYIEIGEEELREFIYESIFDVSNQAVSFATCPSIYALKDKIHLRRMLLLDPVASFYMYEFLLKNWKLFKPQKESKRQYFGYAFISGEPLNPFAQYHEFRKQKYQLKTEYKYFVKVDIANCFNSFYHHDIVSYLSSNLSNTEAQQFGQFLREINRGRSINCFPQGIYPAKALGNGYLSFIETSRELKSPVIIRFLDDIFLFANKSSVLEQDVIVLQQLLGPRNLFLNSEKTQFGSKKFDFEERKLDRIKISLLRKREEICGYDEDDE